MNRIEVVAVTHRGRVRARNEDTLAVAGFLSGMSEGEPVRFAVATGRPVTCLVADGLGGHPEGSRASRLAAGVVADASPGFHDSDAIVRAIHDANVAIHAEMAVAPHWSGMGATIVVLVLTGDEATCVNVGDSRCYVLRDGTLVQLSADDSPAPVVGATGAGPTTVVTQTLGGGGNLVAVRPHVYRTAVTPGDLFLLCSDGLTDEVSPDEVERCLVEAGDQRAAAQALLGAALSAGGTDNVSIVLAACAAEDPTPRNRHDLPRG